MASLLVMWAACRQIPPPDPWFVVHHAETTGLHFTNQLQADSVFNMFKYMYFYNGAGIGAADFNNDGLTDLYFAGNQTPGKLYLNRGNLQFEDVSELAAMPDDGGWSTGVSVVDINNDGLMDIYVCRVGQYESLQSKNLLLVCTGLDAQGIPHYVDSAADYGIDFSGFSTQAVFFDYDLDGDLDLFLLNHAVHHSGTFAERDRFRGTYSELSGDKLYRNEGGRYRDITQSAGIHSTSIGYGLGAVVDDFNHDGWPDLYIGNDFHENDYLYINQRDGTFSEEIELWMDHTSQFTMGVDAADINNDGLPELITADMLPGDPYMLKRSLGEDAYDIFHMKIRYGYNHQYARNNLQLNRGDGRYSEVGLYAGVYATDWSWAPLWFDFDHDGLKDLFVGNGIPKRLNDIDYVNFVSDKAYQAKIRENRISGADLALIDRFPEIKLPNHFFRNTGSVRFEDISVRVAGNPPTFSNGTVYADLDGDGDLDLVVNNIGDAVVVYENLVGAASGNQILRLALQGSRANRQAIGSRLLVFCGAEILTVTKQPVRGFQSSMDIPLHLPVGQRKVDSAWLVWPDNRVSRLHVAKDNRVDTLYWHDSLPMARLPLPQAAWRPFTLPAIEYGHAAGLHFAHTENRFQEFDREPLLPRLLSTEGPALAVADINGDGLEDLFIGNARNQHPAVYLQQSGGRFMQLHQPALAADSAYEDVDACWADVNGDGFPDLLVASGGNEFYGSDTMLYPRLYLNDGSGRLAKKPDAFSGDLYMTWGAVTVADFNGDGHADVFLGARAVPFAYAMPPRSVLLLGDGTGRFVPAPEDLAPGLAEVGMVTFARWHQNLDGNGNGGLLLAIEWGGLLCYRQEGQRLRREEISHDKGWWSFVMPLDYNGDGHTDFLAGNLGLNSRLRASEAEPLRLYVGDFDQNGRIEQILTYHLHGREIPFANKDELQKQMPGLKKDYLYAEQFARATLDGLFGKKNLRKALRYEATQLANAVYLADGRGGYTRQLLPWQAQLAPFRSAMLLDANGNGLTDILLVGNFYENNIQMGRADADRGTLLINRGEGRYEATTLQPMAPRGEMRRVLPITVEGRRDWVIARNNDTLLLYRQIK